MGIKKETKTINDHEYLCLQWNAEKALKMKFRLSKLLGPAMAELAGGYIASSKTGSETREKAQTEALASAIEKLFSNAEPDELVSIIKEVVCDCTRDGEKIDPSKFGEIYMGNLREPYLVFAFVLEVNYADFFGIKSVGDLLANVNIA